MPFVLFKIRKNKEQIEQIRKNKEKTYIMTNKGQIRTNKEQIRDT